MREQDLYNKALVQIDRLVIFLKEFLNRHGEVKAVRNDFSGDKRLMDIYHDFIYYCFIKSSRSIYSSSILAKEYLREDALIIMRTVYENYLRLSYTLKEPEKINEFVFQEIGLRTGEFIYKTSKNGSKNFYKVIDVSNNEEFNHGTKVSVMVSGSINPIDKELHSMIYRYLSEHTHPNMLASGNYRSENNKDYILFPTSLYLELPFFIVYLCFLILDVIYYYHTNLEYIDKNEASKLEHIQDQNKEILMELINSLEFTEIGDTFKTILIDRINKASIHLKNT